MTLTVERVGGVCECGCGKATCVDRQQRPYRFARGHATRLRVGRGGRTVSDNGSGYSTISRNGRNQYVHLLVAEHALGRPLPSSARVHHVNGKDDNQALVICQDQAYHMLLHKRAAALAATGDPNKRKCPYCKRWDDPSRMHLTSRDSMYHVACAVAYNRQRRSMLCKS